MGMDVWVPGAPRQHVEVECFYCDGTGKDTYGEEPHPCGLCHGVGTRMTDQSDGPEYHLSNSNAALLMNMLGFPDSEAWTIPVDQLPNIRRRIIQLLNQPTEMDRHTRAPSDTQEFRGMLRGKDLETGLDTIAPDRGPRMIDFGVNADYLKRRLQNMLEVIEYAQKVKSEVVVG